MSQVSLDNSTIARTRARSTAPRGSAQGGGAYLAHGRLNLSSSEIVGATAVASGASGSAGGGGLHVHNGSLEVWSTSIVGCRAAATPADAGRGGGLEVFGGTARLGDRTSLVENRATGAGNAFYSQGGLTRYHLPAPPGCALGGNAASESLPVGRLAAIDADYPYAARRLLYAPLLHAALAVGLAALVGVALVRAAAHVVAAGRPIARWRSRSRASRCLEIARWRSRSKAFGIAISIARWRSKSRASFERLAAGAGHGGPRGPCPIDGSACPVHAPAVEANGHEGDDGEMSRPPAR